MDISKVRRKRAEHGGEEKAVSAKGKEREFHGNRYFSTFAALPSRSQNTTHNMAYIGRFSTIHRWNFSLPLVSFFFVIE
jgi:hypothetical protein